MGAKIYDSTSASWKDADIPKVYSGSQWMDSEGKVYDNGAWKEGWGNKPDHFLIQNGVLVNELVGSTWIKRSGTDATGSVTSGNGYLIVKHISGAGYNYYPIASKPIQASGYKYICVEASFTDQIGNASVSIVSSFGGSDFQILGIAKVYSPNGGWDYQRYSAGAVSNGSTQGNYLMLSIYGVGMSFYVYNVKLSDDPTGYVVR